MPKSRGRKSPARKRSKSRGRKSPARKRSTSEPKLRRKWAKKSRSDLMSDVDAMLAASKPRRTRPVKKSRKQQIREKRAERAERKSRSSERDYDVAGLFD